MERRFFLILATALLVACATPKADPPAPGDCETIRLWSNGFHTNIGVAAEQLGEDHPLRVLFPEASHFLVGWGERDFYMSIDAGFWMGLKAILPPSPSVMQVIAANEPPEERLWPGDVIDVAISREGVKRLAAAIAETIELDGAGSPIVEGEGRVERKSVFLRSGKGFHLFNMCNHWTARVLRQAGVSVRAALSFSADGLMKAVRRKTARDCPSSS